MQQNTLDCIQCVLLHWVVYLSTTCSYSNALGDALPNALPNALHGTTSHLNLPPATHYLPPATCHLYPPLTIYHLPRTARNASAPALTPANLRRLSSVPSSLGDVREALGDMFTELAQSLKGE